MYRSIGRPAALLATLGALLLAGCGDNDPAGPDDISSAPAAAPAGDQPEAPLAATATRTPRSFFINPKTGNDANGGTSLKPFKTLAKGLSVASSGDTMRLAPGTYSAASNGEKFTNGARQISVPAGVKIFGATVTDQHAALVGTFDDVGLDLKGGATIRDILLSGFSSGVRARQGIQTLKNVFLDQNRHGLTVQGTAKATLTNGTAFVPSVSTSGTSAAEVFEQAQLVIDAGVIAGDNTTCGIGAHGIDVGGPAARLTLKNGAKIEDIPGSAIVTHGPSKVTLLGGTVITRNVFALAACHPGPAIDMGDSSTVTLVKTQVRTDGGIGSVGILSRGKGLLTLDSAVVKSHTGAGVLLQLGLGRLVAKGSRFENNAVGIDAAPLAAAEVTVTSSILTKNTIAIRSPFLLLRSSTITGNVTGFVITRSARFSDLGQPGSPGNNILGGNSQTGIRFDTAVINTGFGAVFATGNTWNPVIQDADLGGHYPLQPLVTGDSPKAQGTNFQMPSGSGLFEIQL